MAKDSCFLEGCLVDFVNGTVRVTEALQISLLGITFPTSLINASVILEERVTFDVKPVNIIGLSRRQDLGLTIQRISYMLKKEKKVMLLFPKRSADYNF